MPPISRQSRQVRYQNNQDTLLDVFFLGIQRGHERLLLAILWHVLGRKVGFRRGLRDFGTKLGGV